MKIKFNDRHIRRRIIVAAIALFFAGILIGAAFHHHGNRLKDETCPLCQLKDIIYSQIMTVSFVFTVFFSGIVAGLEFPVYFIPAVIIKKSLNKAPPLAA